MIIMVSAASVLSVTGFLSLRGAGQGVGGGTRGQGVICIPPCGILYKKL